MEVTNEGQSYVRGEPRGIEVPRSLLVEHLPGQLMAQHTVARLGYLGHSGFDVHALPGVQAKQRKARQRAELLAIDVRYTRVHQRPRPRRSAHVVLALDDVHRQRAGPVLHA